MKGLLWIACSLLGLMSIREIDRDPHPLAIDAAAIVPTPPEGQTPIAIPDPNALYAPCPIAPSNVLPLVERDA